MQYKPLGGEKGGNPALLTRKRPTTTTTPTAVTKHSTHLKISPLVEGVGGAEYGHLPLEEVVLVEELDAEAFDRLILEALVLQGQSSHRAARGLHSHGLTHTQNGNPKNKKKGTRKICVERVLSFLPCCCCYYYCCDLAWLTDWLTSFSLGLFLLSLSLFRSLFLSLLVLAFPLSLPLWPSHTAHSRGLLSLLQQSGRDGWQVTSDTEKKKAKYPPRERTADPLRLTRPNAFLSLLLLLSRSGSLCRGSCWPSTPAGPGARGERQVATQGESEGEETSCSDTHTHTTGIWRLCDARRSLWLLPLPLGVLGPRCAHGRPDGRAGVRSGRGRVLMSVPRLEREKLGKSVRKETIATVTDRELKTYRICWSRMASRSRRTALSFAPSLFLWTVLLFLWSWRWGEGEA